MYTPTTAYTLVEVTIALLTPCAVASHIWLFSKSLGYNGCNCTCYNTDCMGGTVGVVVPNRGAH